MTDRAFRSYSTLSLPDRPGLIAALLRLDARFRQHRSLERLSSERLADLGIDPAEVTRETGNLSWDAPHWWR